jgi:Ca2+:H+ antiporter
MTMTRLFTEIRRPPCSAVHLRAVVFIAHRLAPESHALLFVLSVLAIVPLAALLSHATDSVAGDAWLPQSRA